MVKISKDKGDDILEININRENKIIEIWISNLEKNDPTIKAEIDSICKSGKEQKYMVALFQSGAKDLYQSTRDLLAYNRRRLAELEVLREKKAAGMER